MSPRVLPPLSALFAEACRLARDRLGTLLALALFPLVPLVLFAPFMAEALVALQEGAVVPGDILLFVSPWTAVMAFLGIALSGIVTVASGAAMFSVLGRGADPGPRVAFRLGARVWLAVLWTQLLVFGAALAAAAPALLVTWVAMTVGGGTTLRDSPLLAFLLALVLFFPVFVVITWYAFATIPAARGEVWGWRALAVSHRLVQGAGAQVFGLLLAWGLFELLLWLLLAALFPGLDLFRQLAFTLTAFILGSAYFVAVYNALRRT